LLLAEGNAETSDSWSGSSKGIVDHLRARGHTVAGRNVELECVKRRLAAGAAAHIAKRARQIDVILQVGATFDAYSRGAPPVAVFLERLLPELTAGK
jgi:hypothetical protein